VLFRFDRRTEAAAELRHVTGTLIPELITEMSREAPAAPPQTAPPARPLGFTVSQVDSPELELILTQRGDAARTIIDECATNALRHGSATQMVVSAEIQGQELVVRCVDNGVGLPGGQHHHGLGSRMFDEQIGTDAWSLTREGDRTIAEFRFPWQHGDVTLTPETDSADGSLPR
jgi:signal transduction histidine kinase